jgi:hypothetical protein
MSKKPVVADESQFSSNGVAPEDVSPVSVDGKPPVSPLWVFTEDVLTEMQEDEDVAPTRDIEERELDFCPLAKPGRSFITVHPDPKYSLRWPVTFDVTRDRRREDPYLVMRPMWKHFHPSLLSVKWLVLALRWEDELLKPFLWLAPWREEGEAEQPLHKSAAHVVRQARRGWGQALWRTDHYQWLQWSERQGEPPAILWPDRSFFEIVKETLGEDRIIHEPTHPLILAQGEAVEEVASWPSLDH